MKKTLIFLLALMLSLGLCACAQQEAALSDDTPGTESAYTLPAGTTVLGVDISGMTKEAAWTALEAAAANYRLDLTVDGVNASLAAADIDLSCVQDVFMAGVDAMAQGAEADFSGLVRFNEGKLRSWMYQQFNKAVTEGSIVYDEATAQYVGLPHADGQASNPNALVAATRDAICALTPQQALTDVSQILHPVRSMDDPVVKDALVQANKMLGVKLSYVFTPEEDDYTVDIPAETIRSFVTLAEDGVTPAINESALYDYVADLSDEYSIEGTEGSFRTTHGSTIDFTVSYNGHHVDSEELAQDIIYCMREGISETRTAPYQSSGDRDMAYGGTYVEVDLSSQQLWFYKNGERLVSTSIVSGKVAEGWMTPNGVYSLYDKEAGTYLEGEDYRTFVNYWMPFHGGYGLHDATWRGSFGGDIYHYDGSHGCVNMPYGAASTVFDNASVGTKVIVYGGRTSVPPLTQSLSGTTSYDIADDATPFKLDIKPYYSEPKMSYQSSNPAVATVSADGTVTVKGIGTATITVTAATHKYYTDAKTSVTVNVHSACDEGRHKMGTPTTVKAPTCQPGLEKTSCTKCKHFTEKELKPVNSHSYSQWRVTTAPTCSKEGVQERSCTTCSTEKQTEAVPATGKHTEGSWKNTKEPTCVDAGSKEQRCTVCDTILKTETIPATGNHTEGSWNTTKDATCVEAGSKEIRCTVCDAQLKTEVIPATGNHTAGDWKTVTEATCTTDGLRVKSCTSCGKEMETETIAAGHTPGEWVTVQESTCTQAGSKTQSCTSCGTQLDSAALDLALHSFSGGPTCDNCSEPNPNYTEPTTESTTPPTT